MSDLRPVILVGHCGPDARLLGAAVRRVAPNASVIAIDDEHNLNKAVSPNALLLVNRALDGDFPFADGVELIADFAQREHPPAMMLISNYADAQDRAVAVGALRGFGKSHLYHEDTAKAIQAGITINSTAPR